jgi:hypothetical protein
MPDAASLAGAIAQLLANVLGQGLTRFAIGVNSAIRASVSFGRMDSFLGEEDAEPVRVVTAPADAPIGLEGVSATWPSLRTTPSIWRLRDVTVTFPADKLSIIVGPVGSVRRSLLRPICTWLS